MFVDYSKLIEENCTKLEKLTNNQPIPILVNLYDIDAKYKWTKNIGLGLFHSAIELAGREIGYGGHKSEGTGVFFAVPLTMPPPAIFYRQLYLGTTKKSYAEIADIIRNLSQQWTGRKYHLTKNNCNHFTEEFLIELTGNSYFPSFINRAACVGDAFGCGNCAGKNYVEEGPQIQRK